MAKRRRHRRRPKVAVAAKACRGLKIRKFRACVKRKMGTTVRRRKRKTTHRRRRNPFLSPTYT